MTNQPHQNYVMTAERAQREGLMPANSQGPMGHGPRTAPPAPAGYPPITGPELPDFDRYGAAAPAPAPHAPQPASSAAPMPFSQRPQDGRQQPETSRPLQREKIFRLEVPVDDGSGRIWTELTLRRPRWSLIEEYSSHKLVQDGKLSVNSAIIAACANVPLRFMLDLDGFDGMRLMGELVDFFPQDLRDRLQPTSDK
jgi:hypothetical protein